MVHPRVNEIFARVNERRGVNEIFISSGTCFCFSPNTYCTVCADETKTIFCEAGSVIKPCLKIVYNLLHGGKHAVDKLKQWFFNVWIIIYVAGG